jgi:hypothetical protein
MASTDPGIGAPSQNSWRRANRDESRKRTQCGSHEERADHPIWAAKPALDMHAQGSYGSIRRVCVMAGANALCNATVPFDNPAVAPNPGGTSWQRNLRQNFSEHSGWF